MTSRTRLYLVALAILFIIVRLTTIKLYDGNYYYYGLVAQQFALAEAAWSGHSFAWDPQLVTAATQLASKQMSFVPLETWKELPRSGQYTTFPPFDLPGFGYLIAWTSQLFGSELTTNYAFALQIFVEMASILIFSGCVIAAFGPGVGLLSGLLYIFSYPYILPVATQPMRDIFIMGTFSLYAGAFFLFSRKKGYRWDALWLACLGIASLLLWVRPSAYFFMWLLAPMALFITTQTWRARIAFALASILVPVLIFGLPFKQFNLSHYGVVDTDVCGRGLWEGMGIIPNNPYGFKLNDEALIPWVQSQGHSEIKTASPEMNKVLGDYARDVLRKDPGFYLNTVWKRTQQVFVAPLDMLLPSWYRPEMLPTIKIEWGGHRLHLPLSMFVSLYYRIYMSLGVHLAFLLAGIMLWRHQVSRAELGVLLFPAVYLLMIQLPLHFEHRYMATGAWVLILPYAWGIAWLWRTLRARLARQEPGPISSLQTPA